MKRLLFALHRLSKNPYALLITGIIMAALALAEIAGVAEETETQHIKGGHGVIILGLFLVIRSIAELFKSVEMIEEAEEEVGHRRKENVMVRILKTVAKHPLFEIITGLLLLASGVLEAIDVAEEEQYLTTSVWHFGLVLLGLSMVVEPLAEWIEGLTVIGMADGRWRYSSFFGDLKRLVQKPQVGVTLGFLVIFLGICEEWILSQEEFSPQEYHGMMLFGLLHVFRFMPKAFDAVELVELSEERKTEKDEGGRMKDE